MLLFGISRYLQAKHSLCEILSRPPVLARPSGTSFYCSAGLDAFLLSSSIAPPSRPAPYRHHSSTSPSFHSHQSASVYASTCPRRLELHEPPQPKLLELRAGVDRGRGTTSDWEIPGIDRDIDAMAGCPPASQRPVHYT
eukprot:IDg9198t1